MISVQDNLERWAQMEYGKPFRLAEPQNNQTKQEFSNLYEMLRKYTDEIDELKNLLENFYQWTLVNYPEEDEVYHKDVMKLSKFGIDNSY